jgi:hypothetical protein
MPTLKRVPISLRNKVHQNFRDVEAKQLKRIRAEILKVRKGRVQGPIISGVLSDKAARVKRLNSVFEREGLKRIARNPKESAKVFRKTEMKKIRLQKDSLKKTSDEYRSLEDNQLKKVVSSASYVLSKDYYHGNMRLNKLHKEHTEKSARLFDNVHATKKTHKAILAMGKKKN